MNGFRSPFAIRARLTVAERNLVTRVRSVLVFVLAASRCQEFQRRFPDVGRIQYAEMRGREDRGVDALTREIDLDGMGDAPLHVCRTRSKVRSAIDDADAGQFVNRGSCRSNGNESAAKCHRERVGRKVASGSPVGFLRQRCRVPCTLRAEC